MPHALLVEDEATSQVLVASAFSGRGWSVETTADGAAALARVEGQEPDLVVLDIGLPGLSGIEVCRRLKAHPRLRTVPVLFVTSAADEATHLEAIEAGGAGFIRKPIDPGQLLAYAARLVDASSLARQLGRDLGLARTLYGTVVHDLRNLLQINQAFLQLAQLPPQLPSEVRTYLENAERSAQEMSVLLTTLLDLHRGQQAGLRVERAEVDLVQLVQDRVALAAATARSHPFVVTVEPPDGAAAGARLQTDGTLVARMLDNLLLNAAKFAPAGGAIEVEVARRAVGWSVAVDNGGPALAPEAQAQLFRAFGQLERPAVGARRGVGLGLAFCQMAVEALGGAIGVVSPRPGRSDGVRFHFQLPTDPQ